MEIEVVTPTIDDTKRREVIFDGNNSQINPSTETHSETIKEYWFETPRDESTR